ncbi:MAG: DUF4129 domain-containing protein [Burkholderiales bacterium]|nr:DUF4129 domain-containing protein [Burkholderiales bacterium]
MELERAGVALRPRQPWEAIDLGFVMAREWSGALYAAFLAVFVPVAVALHAALADRLWLATLLAWWLKPLFDRFALHVVSRAVFGEVAGVRATLAAARDILSPGLVASLTLHRLNLARSLILPVWQLEKMGGRAARARRATLGGRMRSHAVGLTIVCVHFELVVMLSLGALVALIHPAAGDLEFDIAAWWRDGTAGWSLADSFAYMTAVAVIEPLYVAGGFALYLNRRAILEGWDVELALRRLAERLAASRATAMLACGALALALLSGSSETLAQPAARADPPGASAKQEIAEVLKAPEFQTYRDVVRWRYRGDSDSASNEPSGRGEPSFLTGLGRFLARLAEFGLWLVAGALVVVALLAARRWLPELLEAQEERYRPPEALFGLAVTPESLPRDLAAAARDLVARGNLREALSLLYRGALSALVHRHRVELTEGDTEGDCARAARGALPEAAARYFERLVGAWQAVAYAARPPDPGVAAGLAAEWPAHFSTAADASAPDQTVRAQAKRGPA